MKRYFRAAIGILAMAFVSMLSSCSNTDYVNAIPKQATAIISVDAAQMSGVGSTLVLKTLLKTTDLGKTGIDLSQKVYLFETAEGNLGVCTAVHDADLLSKALAKAGGDVEEKRGYSFALVGGAWLAGYSDDVMLVLGPVNPGDKASAINQMARFLSQDEDEGAASSQIFQTLDTIQSSMAMVAQASAMPNQLVMPFTLGEPKDADPSQIMVSAKISISKGLMVIDGSTFSFDGLADSNSDILFMTNHLYRESIMDAVNNKDTMGCYSAINIAEDIVDAGKRCLKAFEVKNRFFHFEFFRLNSDCEGVGKKGDIVGLEVNMRPPGGFLPDLINYANDCNVYQL